MAVQPSSPQMCTAEVNESDGSVNCSHPDEPPDKSHTATYSRSAASSKNPAAVLSSQQLQMKKSSFQITCVVPKSTGDSVDDLDDVTNTEDISSDMHAAEAHPDHWSSVETIHSPCEMSPRSPSRPRVSSDSVSQAPNAQSRFRIVKVESRAPSRVRGRWTCMDFSDPPLVTETSSSEGTSTGENACAAAAHIYFVDNANALQVPFTPAFVYSGDHLVLERTPLNSLADNNIYNTITVERNSNVPNGVGSSGIERLEAVTSLSDLADAVGRPGDFAALTSAALLPSDSTDNADSGAGTFAIDNKIEQAMDLVKSHLMFAVHEEVELLKEQIKELMVKNAHLEYENGILRANASPETLALLEVNPAPVPTVLHLVSQTASCGPQQPQVPWT